MGCVALVYILHADGIMSVQILNGMHIYTPWYIFSCATFKLVYCLRNSRLTIQASVLRKPYIYIIYVYMWKTSMYLSKADTKIRVMNLQRLYTASASNLRLFNWNFLNNEEFVRFVLMMIAYDFLLQKWNFLGYNDICFKSIECKHRTFWNINKFIRKCIKKKTLNMLGVRDFQLVFGRFR